MSKPTAIYNLETSNGDLIVTADEDRTATFFVGIYPESGSLDVTLEDLRNLRDELTRWITTIETITEEPR